jgi:hypothetical protein
MLVKVVKTQLVSSESFYVSLTGYAKTQSLKYEELYDFLLFYMGVKLGPTHYGKT